MTAVEAYRVLAADYDRAANPLLALERRTLPDLLPRLAGKLVVDVASGTGYWARQIAAQGARVFAADLCTEMLQHASPPAFVADANRLPLRDSSADVVICAFGLGYAPQCFRELERITRPGGCILVSDVHPEGIRRGWTRSFRHQGILIDVEHHPYELHDLCSPLVRLDALVEPHFGDPELQMFQSAGKEDLFFGAAAHPAIFVARWTRL